MSEARKVYLKAANLAALNRKEARRAALARAHDIRKFEIELYWKRASYFWVLQAAVFTAFGLIWQDGDLEKWGPITVSLACLGALTALASWLAANGSKFWQGNWEFHIDMLEDEFEGRLHKTIRLGRLGVRWSVSGVNDRLLVCFFVFWVGLIWFALNKFLKGVWLTGLTCSSADFDSDRTAVLALVALTIGAAGWLIARLSDLRGSPGESFESGNNPKIQTWPRLVRGTHTMQILKRTDTK